MEMATTADFIPLKHNNEGMVGTLYPGSDTEREEVLKCFVIDTTPNERPSARRRASAFAGQSGNVSAEGPVQPVTTRVNRRASLSGPVQAESEVHVRDVERSAHHSRTERRASNSGDLTGMVVPPLEASDGYESDDNNEGAASRRPSMARRTSTGYAQRRGSAAGDGGLPGRRRTSMTGASRRGSAGYGQDGVPGVPKRRPSVTGRRMSNGYGPPTRRGSASGGRRSSATGANRRASSGFNPEVLARMNRRDSNDEAEEFDATVLEYEDMQGGNMYGYETYNAGTQPPRRGSNYSVNSKRSSRSRRRNSCLIRKGANPFTPDGAPRMSDSDLESDGEYSRHSANSYGYGGSQASYYGYESDMMSDSEHSRDSRRSRRSSRRGSGFSGHAANPSILGAPSRMNDLNLLAGPDDDDLNDPDSLLSRSGFFNTVVIRSTPAARERDNENVENGVSVEVVVNEEDKQARHVRDVERALEKLMDLTPDEEEIESPTSPSASPTPVVNSSIRRDVTLNKQDSWGRATPFTTPISTLTESNLLKATMEPPKKLEEIPVHSLRGNWGDLNLKDQLSSSSDESDYSYGPSMYDDSQAYQEIDHYKQRARRRASMEKSCVDMGKLLETQARKNMESSSSTDGPRVPDFKPATGCTNASDFIVRCFAARLRSGITVIKHNRNRWSKSQVRVIYLLPDGKTLSWKPAEGEADKGKRPKLDLSRCREVRHAWSPDPETKKQLGTSILRKRCKDGMAGKSLSLIFSKRTLDMTALSNDQCRILMEGFSALCFRLQLDRVDDEASNDGLNKSLLGDDDWASTVYGGESTVSISLTNTTNTNTHVVSLPTPWGL